MVKKERRGGEVAEVMRSGGGVMVLAERRVDMAVAEVCGRCGRRRRLRRRSHHDVEDSGPINVAIVESKSRKVGAVE